MKIMIVDDNAEMRNVIKQMLGTSNTEFCEYADGRDAIEAYDTFLPNWVLMDIRLQDIDGLQATKVIKASHPEARIVMVTNYDDPQFREQAKLLGVSGYILKENLPDLRSFILPRNEDDAR
jgi:CheY-like chemotaxis protein